MAELDTGQDILAHYLRRCGELFPNSTTLADADRLIDAKLHCQQGYWDFCAYRPWRWARRDPAIQFASIAKQTVTANSISSANPAVVTLAATIATSQAGRKFYLDADAIPHRINAHTAGSAALTLVTSYVGSGTSGAGAIFMDELAVTSADDILSHPIVNELHSGTTPRGLTLISEAEFRERFPRNVQEADATSERVACFITANKIRIAPWTTSARLFECGYNQRPAPLTWDGVAGTDTPVCPRHLREQLALFGLRRLMTDKRDARVTLIQDEIDQKLALAGSGEMTFTRSRIYVRPGARVMV